MNAVEGRLRARDVRVGCRLWMLDGERTVPTTVTAVDTTRAREVVDVVTDRVSFTVAPDQMLGTPDKPGYELGHLIGADCADGTVGRNYVSLVVNDESFAERYAACLTAATGLPARLEAVSRPSGYLQRDVPGFRVRVVSSYLADLLRQYVGGDAHHMRQGFPRVVLRSFSGTGKRSKAFRTATRMATGGVPRPGSAVCSSVRTSRFSRTWRR
ncbi:hypothetical protein ACFU2J_28410 [Streptomyces sp. NPDC057387]|uniref:hypothetical protein n=1 Tax=Streptomyces sp. NPDC057387 TaxID=3346115 RepID=UPI0036352118